MTNRCSIFGVALAAALAIAAANPLAQTATKPDNTKVNTRDRAASAKTADQQSNEKADLDLAKQIRQAIVADKSLSTYAHNIKVITNAGNVTLKGPVHTAAEKSAVEAKAVEIAGAGKVSNQISVTAAKTGKSSTSSRKDR